MKYTKPSTYIRLLKKSSAWEKVFYIFLFIIMVIVALKFAYQPKEGFETSDTDKSTNIVVKKGTEIYDDFYSNVYDKLVFCKVKNDFEIRTILKVTKPNKNSKVLDIGSGTGHHVAAFTENGINATGIDISPSMIELSKETYPSSNYMVGNAMNGMLFPQGSFTHITCLYLRFTTSKTSGASEELLQLVDTGWIYDSTSGRSRPFRPHSSCRRPVFDYFTAKVC